MIDIEKEKEEFAAMMRARPGRRGLGGNDDAFIASEFFREFNGWLAAKRASVSNSNSVDLHQIERASVGSVGAVECYLATDGEHMQHPAYGGGVFFTEDCLTTAFLAPISQTLSDDEIINIANERHIAMPPDADDQEEMLLIVRDCFEAIAAKEPT